MGDSVMDTVCSSSDVIKYTCQYKTVSQIHNLTSIPSCSCFLHSPRYSWYSKIIQPQPNRHCWKSVAGLKNICFLLVSSLGKVNKVNCPSLSERCDMYMNIRTRANREHSGGWERQCTWCLPHCLL